MLPMNEGLRLHKCKKQHMSSSGGSKQARVTTATCHCVDAKLLNVLLILNCSFESNPYLPFQHHPEPVLVPNSSFVLARPGPGYLTLGASNHIDPPLVRKGGSRAALSSAALTAFVSWTSPGPA